MLPDRKGNKPANIHIFAPRKIELFNLPAAPKKELKALYGDIFVLLHRKRAQIGTAYTYGAKGGISKLWAFIEMHYF
jgi:hypothetical protein